jgi:hypothetical protein
LTPTTQRVAFILALLLAPMSAQAYFDPGAGAVLLQVLVAAAIGATYKLRHWFSHVFELLRGWFRR